MSHSWEDATHNAYATEQGEKALLAALEEAGRIGEAFNQAWATSELEPVVFVSLEAGGEDQPVFVFSLLLNLDDDLDATQYPSASVERFKADLRARLVGTPIDDWGWLVTTGTRTGAARA